jgi:hypothetical protein
MSTHRTDEAGEPHVKTDLTLTGLDGSNLLAFLAALGTLRTATHAWPDRGATMAWRLERGAWRPVMTFSPPVDADSFVEQLNQQLKQMKDHPAFKLGDNLNVKPEVFAEYVNEAVDTAHAHGERVWADFAAAFGCEALTDNGEIQDTAMRTMSGAGHQHFLKFARTLIEETDTHHLERGLFQPWDYADPGPTLRWDPNDDRRYAWRWTNPSNEPGTTMRGANRLALEAMPLLSTVPRANHLYTTGFTGTNTRNTFFRWPIWDTAIILEVTQSLLSLPEIQEQPLPRERLCDRGIVEVFASQRITVGNFRNFTPGSSV